MCIVECVLTTELNNNTSGSINHCMVALEKLGQGIVTSIETVYLYDVPTFEFN